MRPSSTSRGGRTGNRWCARPLGLYATVNFAGISYCVSGCETSSLLALTHHVQSGTLELNSAGTIEVTTAFDLEQLTEDTLIPAQTISLYQIHAHV